MNTLNNSRNESLIRAIALMLCCVMCCSAFLFIDPQVAFCEDPIAEDIGDAVTDITGNIYSTMRTIAIPILIVVICVAGFQFVVGGGSGTEKARKWLIGGLAFLFLIVFAPVIGNHLGTMFKDQGANNFSSYNPLK